MLSGVEWSLHDDADGLFIIGTQSGVVRLAQMRLNYDTSQSHTVVVVGEAAAGGGVRLDGSVTITIAVVDVLDDLRLRDTAGAADSILENSSSGTAVSGLSLQAEDESNTRLSDVVWGLQDNADGLFQIDRLGGVVRVADPRLDYETSRSHTLQVFARASKGGVSQEAVLTVVINVLDQLEEVSITDLNPSSNTVLETATTGRIVEGLSLQALSENGRELASDLLWSISSDTSGLFAISSAIGVLRLAQIGLDYATETSHRIEVSVVAREGDIQVTGSVWLVVSVLDVLEELTITDRLTAPNRVLETAATGTAVSGLHLQALDEASQPLSDVMWSIAAPSNQLFAIGADGVVRVAEITDLSYEEATQHTVEVSAVASKAGDMTLTAVLTLVIEVEDVLEAVNISDSDEQANEIFENATTGAVVSGIDFVVRDEGEDSLSGMRWSLSDESGLFSIDSSSGAISVSSATAGLNYEDVKFYQVVVSAVVVGSHAVVTGSLTVAIAVIDVLEDLVAKDLDSSANTLSERASSGDEVSGLQLIAEDEVGMEVSALLWRLQRDESDLFAISGDGVVRFASTSTLDYEMTSSYQIVVSAQGSKGGVTLSNALSLTIEILDILEGLSVADTDTSINVIPEDAVTGSEVSGLRLRARNENNDPVAVGWELASNPRGLFAIDSTTGAVRVAMMLDYEDSTSHIIGILASVGGTVSADALLVTIEVLNVLEQVVITDGAAAATNSIVENTPAGTTVTGLYLQAADEGGVMLSGVEWGITSSTGLFAIDTTSGVVRFVSTSTTLDYETTRSYVLSISAQAVQGTVTVVGYTDITIRVENVLELITATDSNPTINSIAEDASTDTRVADLRLQALDENNNPVSDVVWRIITPSNRLFAIDETSGDVRLAVAALDYEMSASHILSVMVSTTVGDVSLEHALLVTIAVSNVLEQVVIKDSTEGVANTIRETAAVNDPVEGLRLQAVDEGERILTDVHWSLTNDADGLFKIDTDGTVRLNLALLDYTQTTEHVLVVAARVGQGSQAKRDEIPITVEVLNVLEDVVLIDSEGDTANTLVENAPAGTAVAGLRLRAEDEDGRVLTSVLWGLRDNAGGIFVISATSGEVFVVGSTATDYEESVSHEFVVTGVSSANGVTLTGTLTVVVMIADVLEDLRLSDSNADEDNTVVEGAPSGTAVSGLRLVAKAEENKDPAGVVWSLKDDAGGVFVISTTSAEVRISSTGVIDYEVVQSYSLVASAEASLGGVTLVRDISFEVMVENVLEALHLSDSDATDNTLREDAQPRKQVENMNIVVRDEGGRIQSELLWSLLDSDGGLFAISTEQATLSLSSTGSLNYETSTSHRLIVRAVAKANETVSGVLVVTVKVLNVLEELVIVDSEAATVNTVVENASAGTPVTGLRLEVEDERGDPVIGAQWGLTNDAGGLFVIDTTSGVVRVSTTATLDYEQAPSHIIIVSVSASGEGTPIIASIAIPISVLNVFEQVVVSDGEAATANTVVENAVAGTVVAGLRLQAVDEGSNPISGAQWSLTNDGSGLFEIGTTSGVVRVSATATLDYEDISSHTIVVSVAVREGDETFTASDSIEIIILNVLEQVVIRDDEATSNTIVENAAVGTTVTGLHLQAVDERGVVLSDVRWGITSLDGLFAIDTATSMVRFVSTTATLDYEMTPSYVVGISAQAVQDSVTVVGTSDITLWLENVLESIAATDSNPAINSIAENAASDTVVSGLHLQAVDERGEVVAGVQWSLTDDGGGLFVIDTTSGVVRVSTTATLDYEDTNAHTVVVSVTASADGKTFTASDTVPIAVADLLERVQVIDTDDDPSAIEQNAAVGARVPDLSLEARDEVGMLLSNVVWGLADSGGNTFAIDPASGAVTLSPTAMLDHEETSSYTIVVTAQASKGGVTLTGTLSVTIQIDEPRGSIIVDSNDEPNTVVENAIGSIIDGLSLEVVEIANPNNRVSGVQWSLSENPESLFVIHITSGAIRLASTASLNYEASTYHTIEVSASSSTGGNATSLGGK